MTYLRPCPKPWGRLQLAPCAPVFPYGPEACALPTRQPNENAMPLRSILVVDDVPEILEVFQEVLGEHFGESCHIVTTADPTLVDGLFSQEHFDVMITDYNMPMIDGLSLGKAIRAKYDCQIFLVTGHDQEISSETSIRLFKKPINWSRMYRELDNV